MKLLNYNKGYHKYRTTKRVREKLGEQIGRQLTYEST